MTLLSKIFGGGGVDPAAGTIEAIGKAFDGIFTSDEEKAQARLLLEKLRSKPQHLQAEITKIEASHKSIFVAGWRPYIGWICGHGLAFAFLFNPILNAIFKFLYFKYGFTGDPIQIEVPTEAMLSLVMTLLGLGALRTYEKGQGITR